VVEPTNSDHAGLVGGGNWPRPGEISLAHRGVLFLDELPEFGQKALETLRQPLEDKIITISCSQGPRTFPANFMLVAAMNPCPCGWYGDSVKQCTCAPAAVTRYQKRISGPVAGLDAGTTGTYYFDAFESRRQTAIGSGTSLPEAIFANDFESGDTNYWTSITSTPTVTTAASLSLCWLHLSSGRI
jgi:Magnesium chelatase, subunit ChlI